MHFKALRLAAAGIVVAVVQATAGCATEYVPRTSHRVSIVESGGIAKFTRDSQTFGLWDLDGNVPVRGPGVADARAHSAHRRAAVAEAVAARGFS